MKALLLDPVENLARLEDFPMIDRPWACKRCNFRKLCFPKTDAQPANETPTAVDSETDVDATASGSLESAGTSGPRVA